MKIRFCRSLIILCIVGILYTVSAAENEYSRINSDSMTVADETNWYLEEYDNLGRPSRSTRWEAGEIAAITTWLYQGNAPLCDTRIITDNDGSEETVYDSRGNEIKTEKKDLEGNLVSETLRYWDDKKRETERETRSNNITTREEWIYDDAGELSVRKLFKNGALILDAVYESEMVWTETVYASGKPILTERYENGRKVIQP